MCSYAIEKAQVFLYKGIQLLYDYPETCKRQDEKRWRQDKVILETKIKFILFKLK
jgi:hypothetical protein